MGEPIKIYDLVKLLIKFSGKRLSKNQNNYNKLKIDYVGLREGEKLYEELLIDHKAEKTIKRYIFKSNETKINEEQFNEIYKGVLNSYQQNNNQILKKLLLNNFVNYQPNK